MIAAGMVLKIGRRYSIAVRDVEEASRAYQAARDASGEGQSSFPSGFVHCNRTLTYRISYNGRVWLLDSATPVREAAA